MAELEVAKHGKNVVKLARSAEHGWLHRLREIALEVVIIVFAVSVSIAFHSMSEHRHEQQQVRAFLLGLKSDLTRDMMQLSEIKQSYRAFDSNFGYLANLDPATQPPAEQFAHAFDMADYTRQFIPENSRFEGFKAGGKLTNIEDEELLNDILTLYQTQLRQIRSSEGGWTIGHDKLRAYLDVALERGDTLPQRFSAMTTPQARRLLRNLVARPQLYERYQAYVDLSSKIIKRIEANYPDAR